MQREKDEVRERCGAILRTLPAGRRIRFGTLQRSDPKYGQLAAVIERAVVQGGAEDVKRQIPGGWTAIEV